MFVDFALPHLIFEKDGKQVKHAPVALGASLKPERIAYDTEWLAFVDDKNFGIGISPLSLDRDSIMVYRYWLIHGILTTIRSRVYELNQRYPGG